MVDQPGFDRDQSKEFVDLVKYSIENAEKDKFEKYEYKTMVSNIVDPLKHQHDKYEYIKDINVNIFDMSSKSRSGYSSNR